MSEDFFQTHCTTKAEGPYVCVCVCSAMSNPWTVALQAPLFMGFSRTEHWSGLPLPTPVDSPDLGIELTSLASPGLAGRFFTAVRPGKP